MRTADSLPITAISIRASSMTNNPLHAFYRHEPDLAELSDLDYDNPDVLDYLRCGAFEVDRPGRIGCAHRYDQTHAARFLESVFAIGFVSSSPGLFMFAEAWSFDAEFLAEYTYPENGGISVLDFPGRQAMYDVFRQQRRFVREPC